MKRMWINQPSTLQPFHRLHGTNVLLDEKNETIYFLSGNVISMMIPIETLSKGWR
jgi:hypothetical protein